MCFQQIINISQGLLTPVIGGIAVYIAYQQWRTNKQKLKLDLYERRLFIYKETMKTIGQIIQNGKANYPDLNNFLFVSSEADFLFGTEIYSYIKEIFDHGCNLTVWKDQLQDNTMIGVVPAGYDHKKVSEGIHKEIKWFLSQLQSDRAKNMFMKYLDNSK